MDLLEELLEFYRNALVNEWHVERAPKSADIDAKLMCEIMLHATPQQFTFVYAHLSTSRTVGGFLRKAKLGARAALVIAKNQRGVRRPRRHERS